MESFLTPSSPEVPTISTTSSPLARTVKQVQATAEAAGLTNTHGPVQLLRFSAHLNSGDYKLLEVSPPVLSSLSKGDSVVIRGEMGDDAVLCTEDKTFELRVADTSNMLLLAPSLVFPTDDGITDVDQGSIINGKITGSVSSYLELRPIRPRIEKLKQLLAEVPYRGQECEVTDGSEADKSLSRRNKSPMKYTLEELLCRVQASKSELIEALDRLQACPIAGHWRVFDPDYRDRVCQYIFTLLEEEDWNYKQVPLDLACSKLEELEPRFAIEHCLNCYGSRQQDDSGDYYELSELKVCQFYAELLLRPAGKFNYHEFLSSWQQSVPDGMTTNLDQLEGLALTDMNSAPPTIWHFPVGDLPHDPTLRFQRIFEVRERWTHKEIEPYISDLETPAQPIKALLLKHTRMSKNSAGERVYNSKNATQTR